MKKGLVKISKHLVETALGFPGYWNIEEISLDGDVFTLIISGEDFPEVIPIKECRIRFCKESYHAEIERDD
jgi:hypothetical protein